MLFAWLRVDAPALAATGEHRHCNRKCKPSIGRRGEPRYRRGPLAKAPDMAPDDSSIPSPAATPESAAAEDQPAPAPGVVATEPASSPAAEEGSSGAITPDVVHPAPEAAAPADTPPEAAVNAGEPAASTEGGAPPAPAAEAEARPLEADSEPSEPAEQSAENRETPSVLPGEDAGGPPGAGASEPPGPGDKKKRRRKKKKKPNAEAGDGGSQRPPRPSSERAPFHVGEEVFGKVTALLDTAVMVDLSGKALAIFDRGEMDPDDLVPSVADRFVARVHNDGARGGLVVLTRKPLREEEAKPRVEQAAKDGTLISGLVTGAIKGGVEVDIDGLRAFAPASGMDLHPAHANFQGLVGQRMDFKVLQYKNAGRDVVVTRRPMLEAEAHERRKHALAELSEGSVMKGTVRTVVDWGAFVALPEAENLEGLIHISEASHDPRARIADLFKAGDEIEVQITKIDEKGKIWLSRKALIEDPWAASKQKYPPGKRVTGKVARIEPFGAFIEIEEGVDGLLHVSDLSFDRVEHPQDLLKVGDTIDVVVHHFDQRNKKIALHPAPPPERAEEAPQRIQRGATIKVEVVKAEGPGVVVRVLGVTGRGARGFIPAGQTATSRGTDLRKHFQPGQQLDVKVVDIDPRRGEPKLTIRGLHEDEERRAHREYRQKLKAESSFGTLGDLLQKKLNLQKPPDD